MDKSMSYTSVTVTLNGCKWEAFGPRGEKTGTAPTREEAEARAEHARRSLVSSGSKSHKPKKRKRR